MFAILQ